MGIRRHLAQSKIKGYKDIWPVDKKASHIPPGWSGWPDNKKFAIVLTHDVETKKGYANCRQLMKLEKEIGFRSSFNFVPKKYKVSDELRHYFTSKGFEVGIHGLYHDGKLYKSKATFKKRAWQINKYLKAWKSVGFRSPSMHHNLDWIDELDIKYDSSTFDTDPFEPQAEGVETIFPFWVSNYDGGGYVELPYTMPQDFTIFVLMKETSINIWKKKLDWIVENRGMALLNTHPDYMNFDGPNFLSDEYPSGYYRDLLLYVKRKYEGKYWCALPKDVASFLVSRAKS
jgi:hypothetical protein